MWYVMEKDDKVLVVGISGARDLIEEGFNTVTRHSFFKEAEENAQHFRDLIRAVDEEYEKQKE